MNIYSYLIFVYTYYIQEDWEQFNKIGKFFIKPAWFVRAIIVWSLSLIGFPLVLLHMKFEDKI